MKKTICMLLLTLLATVGFAESPAPKKMRRPLVLNLQCAEQDPLTKTFASAIVSDLRDYGYFYPPSKLDEKAIVANVMCLADSKSQLLAVSFTMYVAIKRGDGFIPIYRTTAMITTDAERMATPGERFIALWRSLDNATQDDIGIATDVLEQACHTEEELKQWTKTSISASTMTVQQDGSALDIQQGQ